MVVPVGDGYVSRLGPAVPDAVPNRRARPDLRETQTGRGLQPARCQGTRIVGRNLTYEKRKRAAVARDECSPQTEENVP